MKKQSMAMNQRDKGLLIILGGVVLAFLIYYFLLNPAIMNLSILRAELTATEAELTLSQDMIVQLPSLKLEETKKKSQLIEKYEPFFYDLNEEQILYKLDNLMIEAGLPVGSYSSTPILVAGIPVMGNTYQPLAYPLLDLARLSNPDLINQIQPNEGSPLDPNSTTDTIPTVDINISFGPTSYPSAISYIQKLEGLNKTIVVKNLTMGADGGNISGSLTISLFSLPKLDQGEAASLQFYPANVKGKSNPFQ